MSSLNEQVQQHLRLFLTKKTRFEENMKVFLMHNFLHRIGSLNATSRSFFSSSQASYPAQLLSALRSHPFEDPHISFQNITTSYSSYYKELFKYRNFLVESLLDWTASEPDLAHKFLSSLRTLFEAKQMQHIPEMV
jgi:hypothetical protein